MEQMEQQQNGGAPAPRKEPLAVFATNGLRGLSVSIAREQFDYDMKPYREADAKEHALVYYDPHTREPISLRPVKFGPDGRYECYDERVLKCLREHKENIANGGTMFMEVPQVALNFTPTYVSAPEGGLTKEDQADVDYLAEMGAKQMLPPPAREKLVRTMDRVAQRFSMRGIEIPAPDRQVRILQGRALEMVDLLAERNIVTVTRAREAAPDERRSDSG